MREFASFDPSAGSGTLVTNGINVNEQLMIYNDSIYRLRFHFNDGSIGVVPPLWNKDYIIANVPLGDIKWEVIDSLSIASNPSLMVYGEVYEADEHVASVNASMQRSVVSSIPGGISTSVVSLESTGANISPDGTNIITISDSLGNTFTLDNNGLAILAVKVGAALVQILKSNATDPLLQLGSATHTLEVLGDLTIDGSAKVVSKQLLDTTGNILADWTQTAVGLAMHGNPAVTKYFGYGRDQTHEDFHMGAISLTGISFAANGTYNHNCTEGGSGVVPDEPWHNPYSGAPPGSQTMGFQSFTTTTVFITTGAGLAGKAHMWVHA